MAKKHSPSRLGAVSRVWFLGEEPSSGYSSSVPHFLNRANIQVKSQILCRLKTVRTSCRMSASVNPFLIIYRNLVFVYDDAEAIVSFYDFFKFNFFFFYVKAPNQEICK